MENKFARFIVPSIISSVVLGTFSIIDGLFIGNKIGDIGLAAINYAYPITAFIQSVGFGLGIAGSVAMSVNKAKDNVNKYISTTYFLFIILTLIMMCLFIPFDTKLLVLFGASGKTLNIAKEYLDSIIYFSIFHVLAQGLVPILRNMGYNKTVMVSVVLSLICNLFLDYLFIYPLNMSLFGAALATNIAQIVPTVFCIIVLLFKKNRVKLTFDFKISLTLFKNSLSPFGVSFATNIVIIIINKACSLYASDQAVAAYTATAYITYIVQKLIQGVCDGVQPLLSLSKGENDKASLKSYFIKSLVLSLIIALASTIISIILNTKLGVLFGLSSEALIYFKDALIIFSISFVGQGITRSIMSYFYSKENNLFSSIITYGEPIGVLIFAYALPASFGINGIWLSIPFTHYILSFVAIILILIDNKKEYRKE